jgi:hypothetical protein
MNEEVLRIRRMLAEGKITVEESARRFLIPAGVLLLVSGVFFSLYLLSG